MNYKRRAILYVACAFLILPASSVIASAQEIETVNIEDYKDVDVKLQVEVSGLQEKPALKNAITPTFSFNAGEEIKLPTSTNKRIGYHFSEWVVFTTNKKDVLNAKEKWEKNVLTLTFKANGGTLSVDNYHLSDNDIICSGTKAFTDKYTYDSSIKLPTASYFGLSRKGYKFIGWEIKGLTTASESKIQASELCNDYCNTTVIAKAMWELDTDAVLRKVLSACSKYNLESSDQTAVAGITGLALGLNTDSKISETALCEKLASLTESDVLLALQNNQKIIQEKGNANYKKLSKFSKIEKLLFSDTINLTVDTENITRNYGWDCEGFCSGLEFENAKTVFPVFSGKVTEVTQTSITVSHGTFSTQYTGLEKIYVKVGDYTGPKNCIAKCSGYCLKMYINDSLLAPDNNKILKLLNIQPFLKNGSYENQKIKEVRTTDDGVEFKINGEWTNKFVQPNYFCSPMPYSDTYATSTYGARESINGRTSTYHGGIDIVTESKTTGKDVVAIQDGTIICSEFNDYGNCVMLETKSGIVALYGHLDDRTVKVGDKVKKGDVVGHAGNTYGPNGYSTGPHLHFEIRVNGTKVDPEEYIDFNFVK